MFVPQWLHQLQRCLLPRRLTSARKAVRRVSAPCRVRLCLEGLEERLTPSSLNLLNNATPAILGQVHPNTASSTTTTASAATATFSTHAQNVTLTATVTSSAGTVNEGSVTFTLLDSKGNTIGTATTGAVSNGSVSVSYSLPGGTAAGSYTIEADYTDSSGTFAASSDSSHTLTVNAANATSLRLAAVNIVPDLSSGTAQMTLTALVSNPAGVVGQGIVTFTIAGVSAQGDLVNGMTIVHLTVPLLTVDSYGLNVALSYTDNAPAANFANSSTVVGLPVSNWNLVLPGNLTFDPNDDAQMQFSLANALVISASYSPSTYGLLSQINVGPLSIPVVYTHIGSDVLATVEDVPWGILFFNSDGQLQGSATPQTTPDGSLDWVIYDAKHNPIGVAPYGE
jgi:hypothetical protein